MRRVPPQDTQSARVHDCWNSIGIRGDKSCPELAAHAHCHNCPAYAAAAAVLLNRRELPAAWAETADGLDGHAFAASSQIETGRAVLLVRLGAEWFALPMLALDQVIENRTIHSLPHRRNSPLLGLANVRGELLICVSLAGLLGVGTGAGTADKDSGEAREGRMVVMRSGGGRVVFPVDEVHHHCRFDDDAVRPIPATARMSASSFVTGLIENGGRLVAIVDEDRLAQAIESCLA